MNFPLKIKSRKQINGDFKFILRTYYMKIPYSASNISTHRIIHRPHGKYKQANEISFPVNVLVFCVELELSEKEFGERIADPGLARSHIMFRLDTVRIPSPQRLLQMLKNCSSLKFYKPQEVIKGLIVKYAGMQFAHKNGKTCAFIRIEASNPANSKIEVLSEKSHFICNIIKK
eukprot:TRINITY_DN12860_c0_g2_i1.p1 TRINITY_DN12860_c0_g2~~TRINITY_DN12860_c0_g2_i1.p1  ORF type:complete len:174 (-),score=31.84 TRINITY_DN12860_c0_g2_i1:68-589(-)